MHSPENFLHNTNYLPTILTEDQLEKNYPKYLKIMIPVMNQCEAYCDSNGLIFF